MSEVVERVVDEETLDEKTGLILRTTSEGKTIVVSQDTKEYEPEAGESLTKVTVSPVAKQQVPYVEGFTHNTQGICI